MITANFNAYSKYVTDSLNQWDLNQVLQVTGLNLTTAPEVHFSNANNDRAIVRQSTMTNHVVSVNIPNSLLQDPLRIYAHIGIYEGSTFKVVELVEIPVIARKRPEDYQIEANDEEVYSFKRLENLLSNLGAHVDDTMATKAQVANIVSGVGSDAELVDVRYGADGKTYASAGEAVREQMAAAKAAVTAYARELKTLASGTAGRDLLVACTWEPDVGLNSSDGNKLRNNAAGYNCTEEFVPVLPNTTYRASAWTVVCEYDAFGVFLVGHNGEANYTEFTTTDETVYVLCAQRPNNATPVLVYADAVMVKKRLSVLGDSYSTYGGFVMPNTNRCFYNGESEDENTTDVSDMWWYKLLQNNRFMLEANNSYSGAPICNAGYDGADASEYSFLGRMGNIGRPDTIVVFGGTNDSWAGVSVGDYKYSGFTEDDLKTFRPAFAYMCEYLQKHNPNADIYVVINSGLSYDVSASMTTIAEHYGIAYVELPDFNKPYGGHPGVEGQTAIYNAVKDVIV